jgi:hypothetical protein
VESGQNSDAERRHSDQEYGDGIFVNKKPDRQSSNTERRHDGQTDSGHMIPEVQRRGFCQQRKNSIKPDRRGK